MNQNPQFHPGYNQQMPYARPPMPYQMQNGMQYMMRPPAGLPVHMPMAYQQQQMAAQNMRPQMPGHAVPDQDVGDELDDISARDIAMARYKRNHDYLSEILSEIFTPHSASSANTSSLDITQTKEELERLIEENKAKTKELQEKDEQRMKELRQERDQFWKSLDGLKQASTIDALDSVALGSYHVKHNEENKRAIPISGLEEEPEEIAQEQQHQAGMVDRMDENKFQDETMFNGSEDQNDNDNFMSSELSNADGDANVSEFLNTAYMDFDPPEEE